MAVTLKDIAAMVGVSVNTVSRALKDKPDIGPKTSSRIKEAAAALGYRPNLNARSLVLKKTFTIGILVTEPDNPVRIEFCERLRGYAANDNYRLLNISLSSDWQKNVEAVEDLLARRVDALVIGYLWGLISEQAIGPILQECRKEGIPVVVFGNPKTELADCIEIDFRDSAFQLTSHAIRHGFRDIALFVPPSECARVEGYRQAMIEHGLDDHINVWPLHGSGFAGAVASLEAYLDKFKKPPRAVIGFNDISAIGIISALKKHNYRVPEDCAVAGVDNISYGEYHDPPLTSIGFDNGYFAETVWNLLKKRMNKTENGPAKHLKLHQKLVIRQSC